jgi:hypothetical protein
VKSIRFSAECSRMNVDLKKPYSPGEGFARPHLYMVFTNYSAPGVSIDIVPD